MEMFKKNVFFVHVSVRENMWVFIIYTGKLVVLFIMMLKEKKNLFNLLYWFLIISCDRSFVGLYNYEISYKACKWFKYYNHLYLIEALNL